MKNLRRKNKHGIFAYCAVECCTNRVQAKGLCDYHYHVMTQYGPNPEAKRLADHNRAKKNNQKFHRLSEKAKKDYRKKWAKEKRQNRAKNLERERSKDRKRYQENPTRRLQTIRKAKERARNLDKQRIRQSYIGQLQFIDQQRPPGHDVDHIIPINHKAVCGLDVPWNLQYLPSYENGVKSNSFDFTWENVSWRERLNT